MEQTGKKVLYIAGQMTTDEQRAKFAEAEAAHRAEGWDIINPAERVPPWMDRAKAMPLCIDMMNAADAVLLLAGWQESEGARLEALYAAYTGKGLYADGDRADPGAEPDPKVREKLLIRADTRKQACKIIMDIHHAGGCGATEPWDKGWDDAMTEAIRLTEDITGVTFREAVATED